MSISSVQNSMVPLNQESDHVSLQLTVNEQKSSNEIEIHSSHREIVHPIQPRSIHEYVLNGFIRKQNEMEIQFAPQPRTYYRFYKPNWSLADMCGLANALKIHGRYEKGIGSIYPQNAPNGLCYALAGMAVRRDYAERAYDLLVKKWDIKDRKPLSDFNPPLDSFTRRATDEEIDALVEYRKKLLDSVVKQLCDENGTPLDPCIEKIFVPTPEESRDIFKISPEGIVQSDTICFLFKRETITIPEDQFPDPKLLKGACLRAAEYQRQIDEVQRKVLEHPPILQIGPSPQVPIFKKVIYPREILAPPIASAETIGWTLKKGITNFGSMFTSFFHGGETS